MKKDSTVYTMKKTTVVYKISVEIYDKVLVFLTFMTHKKRDITAKM